MGLMMTKEQDRNTELNRRITADLENSLQSGDQELPDFADDSNYLKDTEETGRFSWFWIILIALAAIALVCIVLVWCARSEETWPQERLFNFKIYDTINACQSWKN